MRVPVRCAFPPQGPVQYGYTGPDQVTAVFAIVFTQQWWIQQQYVETIPYSEFETLVKAGK